MNSGRLKFLCYPFRLNWNKLVNGPWQERVETSIIFLGNYTDALSLTLKIHYRVRSECRGFHDDVSMALNWGVEKSQGLPLLKIAGLASKSRHHSIFVKYFRVSYIWYKGKHFPLPAVRPGRRPFLSLFPHLCNRINKSTYQGFINIGKGGGQPQQGVVFHFHHWHCLEALVYCHHPTA